MDFAIGLMNYVVDLSDRQLNFFGVPVIQITEIL